LETDAGTTILFDCWHSKFNTRSHNTKSYLQCTHKFWDLFSEKKSFITVLPFHHNCTTAIT
jgi:hypothetical protein